MEDQLMANASQGQAVVQKMIDDGVSATEAQQWGAQQHQKMLTDGVDPNEAAKYWGGAEPDMSAAQALLKQGMQTVPPEKAAEVASDPWGFLKAGFQTSDIGLMTGKPTMVAGSDPSLLDKIMQGLGQGIGDLPVMIAGGVAGGAAASEVPFVGTAVGAGAGASALPEAWRQVLMDHYASHEGPFTWRDFMGRVGSMAFETGKAAVAGAIGGKVAGGVEAVIAKTTLGEGAAKVVGLQAFGVAAAASGAAMNGKVPDAEDFAAGAVLGLGFSVAGHVVGATQRFVTTDAGAVVQENLRETYSRNGLDPVLLGHLGMVDPVVLSETMAPHGPDGEPMTPVLDGMRHPDPDPPHPPEDRTDRADEGIPAVEQQSQQQQGKIPAPGPFGTDEEWAAWGKQQTEEGQGWAGGLETDEFLNVEHDNNSLDIQGDHEEDFVVDPDVSAHADKPWERIRTDQPPENPSEIEKTWYYRPRIEENGYSSDYDLNTFGAALRWSESQQKFTEAGNLTDADRAYINDIVETKAGAKPGQTLTKTSYWWRGHSNTLGEGETFDPNDTSRMVKATWVGSSRETAEGFSGGNISRVAIAPGKYFDFRDASQMAEFSRWLQENGHQQRDHDDIVNTQGNWGALEHSEKLQKFLHTNGYDGYFEREGHQTPVNLAVFKKDKIKVLDQGQQGRALAARRGEAPEFKPDEPVVPDTNQDFSQPGTLAYAYEHGTADRPPETEAGGGGQPPAIPPSGREVGPPGAPGSGGAFPLNEDMIDSRILDVVGEKGEMQQKNWLRRLVGMFQGQLEGARQLEEELGGVDKGQVGIVDMLRSVFGARDRAGMMIRFGGVDAITQRPTDAPSVLDAYKAVREDGGTLSGYVAYRIAKRAMRLAADGRESGVDLDMAQAKMALDNTKYERGDRIMQGAKNGVIKYGVDSGLFSQAQADAMMATDDHVMFRRIMDPTYAGPKVGRNFRTKMPVKRFEGSERLIENPVVADLDNIHTIVAMADRNRASVSIMNWVFARNEQARVAGAEEAARFSRVEAINARGQPVEAELQDANGNPLPGAENAYQPFIAWRKTSAGLGPNDFIVYHEGQGQIIHTENADLAALMRLNMGGEQKNVVVRALEGMAAFTRAGITASLDFPFRSLTHGQLARAAFAEHGSWVPYGDFVGNVMEVWNQGDRFKRFMASGAGGAALTDMDTNYISRDIGKIFDETGVDKGLWGVATSAYEGLRKFQIAVDTAARMGHMERMENKGFSTLKAAMSSRTAYLDHAEGFASSAVNAFARMVPFFSIGLKDLEQVGAAMKRDPLMFAARGAATLTSLSVLNFTANHIADQMIKNNPNLTDAEKESQLYSNLPRWERDMYWVWPAINGVRVKIKKPYVGAMLFNVMPERFMEWASGDDPKAFKDWASATAAQMIPPFMPSLMQPIVENVANRSTFNWRPVIKASLEERSGYMQYTPDTTAPAKAIAKLLGPPGLNLADISPAWVDQYVREWGGTLPFTVMKTLGQAWEPNQRPWDITQLPFVGSFFARNPGMGADAIANFYDKLAAFKQGHADLRAAMQDGDFSRIAPSDALRGAMSVTGLDKAMRGITQNIAAIGRDKTMTDVEKRQRIDSLTGAASLAAKAGTRMLEQADKAARNAPPLDLNNGQ